jgi:RNA polymerase I-specific transcription initiation factor RRN5
MEPVYTSRTDETDLSRAEPRIFSLEDSSSSYRASSGSDIDQKDVSSPSIDSGRQKRYRRSTQSAAVVQPSSGRHGESQLASSVKGHHGEFYVDAHHIDEAVNSANISEGMAGSGHVSSRDDETGSRITLHRNRSKKRKAEKLAVRNSKVKRLRGVYNDDYRLLLNEDIRDAASFPTREGYEPLPRSQLGISVWTSAEKEKFFTALARLGKDNVREIASRIGSKSEIEVQEYIQLLHQGILEKALNEPRRQLLGLTEIPAASQVSEECCNMLENAADALAFRQERHEEQAEQKKWGEYWVLTSNVNNWIEENLEEEGSSHGIREILPAAELLNLRNWLELSSRVFMNPAAPRDDENWHSLAGIDEEPAIRATAFSDFHNLTISITKRLISATIFSAMSRLRAMDSKFFKPEEVVKVADVEAAVKIVGLEINSEKFWVGCPRRCALRVYKTLSLAAAGQEAMGYDEIEKALTGEEGSTLTSLLHVDEEAGFPDLLNEALEEEIGSPGHASGGSESDLQSILLPEGTLSELVNRDLASEYMREIMSEFHRPIDPSDSEFDNPRKHQERALQKAKLKAELDRAHDEYAETFDLQASLVEEQKLWNILKQDPPFTIKPENMELPEQPKQDRKAGNELEDWRNNLNFRSEWETLEKPVPPSAFSKITQNQRRNRASTIGDEESEVESKTSHKELADFVPQDADSETEEDTPTDRVDVLSKDLANR